MGFNEVLTGVLILLGAGVLVLSLVRTRNILSLVEESEYNRGWRTLFFLMLFFTGGYLITLLLVIAGISTFLIALTGVIFFFGALFVFVVVRIGYLTINELLGTQRSLVAARDEALRASNLKTELLARVSHELRTPLHAILGYSEMLDTAVHGPLSQKQKDVVGRISVNADQLVTQINHLLQQAQIEVGELTIQMEPMRPADLINHVDLIVGPLAEQNGLDINFEIGTDLPSVLMGDYNRLQEIVTNLAGNAVKFTDEGEVSVRLYRYDERHWAIEVSDSGLGIPTSTLPDIFEPFRQGDGSNTRRFGGTGLGLSIVKQITDLMGGDISVESEVDKGSRFTVILPLILSQEEVLV